MASLETEPVIGDISPGLNRLLRGITQELSADELQNVVGSIKSNYKGNFEAQKDRDLYSCLLLLHKQGHVSDQNLTLIERFVAPKTTKKEGIKQRIDAFKKLRQQELKPREELKGRGKDVEIVQGKLMTGRQPVITLYGGSGVGKTTLAKEICARWQWKQIVVDLREVSQMEHVYFNLMLALGSSQTLITDEANPVIAQMQQLKKDSQGDILLLLDNVDQFAGGDNEAAKTLNANFIGFLERLLELKSGREKTKLKILLTSRYQFLGFPAADNYEVKALEKSISGELIGPGGVRSSELEKLLDMCKGKPLLLNGLAAILRQEAAKPEELLRKMEPLETPQPLPAPPLEAKEKPQEKAFDFEKEGIDEQQLSCLRKIFFFLPSKQLKNTAVSMSLFCRAFTVDAAAKILGVDSSEAVVLLEGLRNSKVLSVDPEAKELLYDIHPLLQKFLRSIGNSRVFNQVYQKANERFCNHFIGRIKDIATLLDKDYINAFNRFDFDKLNFELALDISFKSDYLLIPNDYHESVMIFYVFEAMLDENQRRKIFNSWASKAGEDGKEGSIIGAEMRSREALQVLSLEGWRKAMEVLKSAEDLLKTVQQEYKTSELYQLTRSSYLYAEGEIYCRIGNIPRALESLNTALSIMDDLLKNHTSTARCLNAIGNCYNKLDQFDKAMECYTKAYDMREELSGSKKHFDMPLFKGQIGTIYEGQEKYIEAIKYYQEALELAEELNISGILYKALFYRNIANAYAWMQNFEAAYKPAQKAYEIRMDILGRHPLTARSAFQLGEICKSLEEFEEAKDYFAEAWKIEKSLGQGNHSEVRDRLIRSYERIQRGSQKEEFQKEAWEFYQRIWEEEKGFEGFEFSQSNRAIIDSINERVDRFGTKETATKYEKDALWFYEGAWNSSEIHERPFLEREDILQHLLRLCKMLSEKERFHRYQREAVKFYEKELKEKKEEMELQEMKEIVGTLLKLAEAQGNVKKRTKYERLLEKLRAVKESQKGWRRAFWETEPDYDDETDNEDDQEQQQQPQQQQEQQQEQQQPQQQEQQQPQQQEQQEQQQQPQQEQEQQQQQQEEATQGGLEGDPERKRIHEKPIQQIKQKAGIVTSLNDTTLTKVTYGKYATRVPDEVAYGIYEWFSSQ